jgi:transcriptional regulator with XRE-family HTH domain
MANQMIALRIKTMRMSREMTQSELAEALGVSVSAVGMWESGKREPNFDMLEAMADVFNVPMSAFLDSSEMVEMTGKLPKSDCERLEVLHRNPRLCMLFDRARNMSDKDIEMILSIANRIIKEDDEN